MFSLHIDTARSWRGGQNQAFLTVTGLQAAGQRVMLVANPWGELRRRASEGIDVVALAPRTEMDLAAAWKLSRVVSRFHPDVLHAHDPHGVAMAALALSMGAPSPRPPLIASRRVDFSLRSNAFSRWKYRQVDLFVCASDAIRSILLKDGVSAARAVTVHEGVDVDRIDAIAPISVHAEYWLPSHAPIVGNVAALVPHKGQRHLIAAARIVLRDVPDARFVILGEGELREALQRQVKELGLEKHVFLPGFRPDVIALMKTFDLFAMSSVTEGLGTAVLDAMACKLPVVATRAGGLAEIVEDGKTGLLVDPRDESSMAASIVALLGDGERRCRMGEAGAALVRRRFSAERMVHGTAKVYEAVLRKTVRADTLAETRRD